MDEHKIELENLVKRLGTDLKVGLSTSVANERLKDFGKNVLKERMKVHWSIKFLREFTSLFAIMLWIACLLSFISYAMLPSDPSNMFLGVVVAIAVLVSGSAAFFQNAKSEAIMESFKNFIPPETICIRDGKESKINATLLVPGDIIKIETGKRIPADIRIIEHNEMKVDNSSLTGESEALIRSAECTNKENPLETKNLAFFGTLCREGRGIGIVIFTGDHTVIG